MLSLKAQSGSIIRGKVKDSSGNPVIGANIFVYNSKDSAHCVSDVDGLFNTKISPQSGTKIRTTYLGYDTSVLDFDINKLTPYEVVLNPSAKSLKEFVVKGTAAPMKLKFDTVEFNVDQYINDKYEMVQDLFTKFPGLDVEPDGSISINGKKVTKIKINGQEYMISNIKSLTSIIPANMISKIQFVDDYDELGRLTGRRNGVPNITINLVTPKDISTIYNLRVDGGLGNENKYLVAANGGFHNPKDQLFFMVNNNNKDAAGGNGTITNGEAGYHYNFNKQLSLNVSGRMNNQSAVFQSFSQSTDITDNGTLNSVNNGTNYSANKLKELNLKSEYKITDNDLVLVQFSAGNTNTVSQNNSATNQTGFQKKDINNVISQERKSNNWSGSVLASHTFNKSGRILSLQLSLNNNDSKYQTDEADKIRYYNDTSYVDSTILQQIHKDELGNNSSLAISYVEPVKENASFELKYIYQNRITKNSQLTSWGDENGKLLPVDSLSSQYKYAVYQHQVEGNYQLAKGNAEYTIGLAISPNQLKTTTTSSGTTIFPVLKFRYKWPSLLFSINYQGQTRFPTYQQIAPVTDLSNIQYPIVGNPSLKIGQSHSVIAEFTRSGKSSFWGRGMYTKNIHDIAVNTILIEDVLGTVKQETHYLNTNGNFSGEAKLGWSRQFGKVKNSIRMEMGTKYSHNILFANNVQKYNDIWNVSIKLNPQLRFGWVTFIPNFGYQFNRSKYNITEETVIDCHTFNMGSYLFIKFPEGFSLEAWGNKQLNWGYASGAIANPLSMDMNIGKKFFGDKITILLECNNVFNQRNSSSYNVSANSVSIGSSSVVSRFFMLHAIYRFSKAK
ncbi:hypothetical protein BW716_33425 [[Flexibacter] sp. ATCC 35208]|nr:hypothetical protein BW716_33425 [[Flexibacter] sp. ATCC 35208]